MSGLTSEGFVPLTYEEIRTRIQSRLETFNPGFDFSPESPDGQLIDIMGFELSQAWTQIDQVYNSYNPDTATGQAIRNIGFLTGIPFQTATRSQAVITLTGTLGTVVPKKSIVEDVDGNEFATEYDAVIGASGTNVTVIANVSGPIDVTAGKITTIQTSVSGWTGITHDTDGVPGSTVQTEHAYRNLRNRTVLRNFNSVVENMEARLLELGIEQATILNNDTINPIGSVPAGHIHITVGEYTGITDAEIAQVILETKGIGCPTYGTSSAVVEDSQGFSHTINFTKATEVPIYMEIEVIFHDEDKAGALEKIQAALADHINSLQAGEDVIYSRLYQYITPFAKAEVTKLWVNDTGPLSGAHVINVALTDEQFASQAISDIGITDVTP
jgi:uncharacterized phage protein gp47/JayE